jgi:flagellin
MVVQHNLQAMNSNRMLGLTQNTISKSTERLSSGYRINRAADDAAGLAISEKMRKQIKGLNQASSNAQDGISCVQTAEGALAEVEDMLQRMNQLAVQAANGTNSESDRTNIQDEIDQLVTEIDRVSETTKFNEIYLLKGSTDGGTLAKAQFNYTENQAGLKIGVQIKNDAVATTYYVQEDGAKKYITDANVHEYISLSGGTVSLKKDVEIWKVDTNTGYEVTAAAGDVAKVETTTTTSGQIQLYDADGNKISENALKEIMMDLDYARDNLYLETGDSLSVAGIGQADLEKYVTTSDVTFADDLELTFHVGSEGQADNKIDIDIQSMGAVNLGVDILKSDKNGIVDTDGQLATDAIKVIEDAINQVSKQRSELGAVQNRLEHTINNLDNVAENTTAAESQIRDTDMAKTMVEFSNANILAQAGQSMLAQANQSNQGVLSLLG